MGHYLSTRSTAAFPFALQWLGGPLCVACAVDHWHAARRYGPLVGHCAAGREARARTRDLKSEQRLREHPRLATRRNHYGAALSVLPRRNRPLFGFVRSFILFPSLPLSLSLSLSLSFFLSFLSSLYFALFPFCPCTSVFASTYLSSISALPIDLHITPHCLSVCVRLVWNIPPHCLSVCVRLSACMSVTACLSVYVSCGSV